MDHLTWRSCVNTETPGTFASHRDPVCDGLDSTLGAARTKYHLHFLSASWAVSNHFDLAHSLRIDTTIKWLGSIYIVYIVIGITGKHERPHAARLKHMYVLHNCVPTYMGFWLHGLNEEHANATCGSANVMWILPWCQYTDTRTAFYTQIWSGVSPYQACGIHQVAIGEQPCSSLLSPECLFISHCHSNRFSW